MVGLRFSNRSVFDVILRFPALCAFILLSFLNYSAGFLDLSIVDRIETIVSVLDCSLSVPELLLMFRGSYFGFDLPHQTGLTSTISA